MKRNAARRFPRMLLAHYLLPGLMTLLCLSGVAHAQDTSFTVLEGATHNGAVSIGDAPFSLFAGPSLGMLSFNADGSFAYTAFRQPTLGFVGSDSFRYNSADQGGGDEAHTVSITIIPVNDAPIALPKSFEVLLGETYSGQVEATDVDGDALNYMLLTAPANGVLIFNADGSFTYTASLLGDGTDSFSFRANDGLADSNTANVGIIISGDPLFSDRFEMSDAGTPLTCPEDDPFEPNDDLETAAPIVPGTTIEAIVCSGNLDHFVFNAEGGESLNILLTFSHLEGDLDMALYEEGGAFPLVTSESSSDNELIFYDVPPGEGGSYIVRVFGFGSASNIYSLLVDVTNTAD